MAGGLLGLLVAGCLSHCSSAITVASSRTAAEREGRPMILAERALEPLEPAPRAAICYAGGFRTFSQTLKLHRQRVIDPWPAADLFMFVELDDTFSSFKNQRNRSSELDRVRELLRPVDVRTYTQYEARASQQGIQCFSHPTLSHQMWTIKECFGMVTRHETAARMTYAWFVRARPDTRPTAILPVDVFKRHTAPDEKVAWRRGYSGGSDCLCVMTRAAAESLGRAHDSLFLSAKAGQCGFGASDATGGLSSVPARRALGRICGPSFHGNPYPIHFGMSPVCFFWLAWASDNVTVMFDDRVSANPLRPQRRYGR
jgi:hypothetical protein